MSHQFRYSSVASICFVLIYGLSANAHAKTAVHRAHTVATGSNINTDPNPIPNPNRPNNTILYTAFT